MMSSANPIGIKNFVRGHTSIVDDPSVLEAASLLESVSIQCLKREISWKLFVPRSQTITSRKTEAIGAWARVSLSEQQLY